MKVESVKPIRIDKDSAKKYVLHIAKEQFGQIPQKIKYLGGGSFGSTYRLDLNNGEKIVVKFFRANDMMAKEVFDLKLFGEISTIKFPKVLFERSADTKIPIDCYGMEYIDGKSAVNSIGLLLAGKKKRQQFADNVTTALHEIHKHTNAKFGDTMHPGCDSWLDYYKPIASQIYAKAEEMYAQGKLAKKINDVMRLVWENFDKIFANKVEKACLIHGDLNVCNVMVKNGKIVAFIDPLNSMYADRDYDLFQFDNILKNRFNLRKTYIAKYGANKDCDAKCAFYALWNEVYCVIKSGVLVDMIMNPLVKNMQKILKELQN